MVTSVLPMMMMTVFAVSLVEIVQVARGKVNCPSGEYSFEAVGCCPTGTYIYGTWYDHVGFGCCDYGELTYQSSGCCPKGSSPHAFGGCCPTGSEIYLNEVGLLKCCEEGYKPWQLNDGSMTFAKRGRLVPGLIPLTWISLLHQSVIQHQSVNQHWSVGQNWPPHMIK